MQLRLFTSGLNTRLHPALIDPSEATELCNVDTTEGILKPIRLPGKPIQVTSKYFYYYQEEYVSSDNYRDYLEYQGKLYWTEKDSYPRKYNGRRADRLGIKRPDNPLKRLKFKVTEAPKFASVAEPEAFTIPNVERCKQEEGDGGDLLKGSYNYKLIVKQQGITSKPLEMEVEISEDDKKLTFSAFEGVEDTIYVYRKYEDVFRLVGSVNWDDELVDDTLDISSKEELEESEIFPLGESLRYAYDAYNPNTKLRTQEFKYIKLSNEQKTYKVVLEAESEDVVTIYREYEGVYRLVGTEDNKYRLDSAKKPKEEKYPSGTYIYCYTYYNDEDGTESQPSEYSVEVNVDNGTIEVYNFEESSDWQVTNMQLYRMGGNLTAMSRVATLDRDEDTYIDRLADVDIDGYLLDSYNHREAPKGLLYLTQVYGMFFGALREKMYFSEIGNPNYWSDFNFIAFDAEITGIGVVPNGIIVFTYYKTYIITGTDTTTFVKHLVSGEQGCISHKSVQYTKNSLIWASTDGLCATVGGEVTVLTKPKIGKLYLKDIVQSVVHDEVYYILHSEGIFVADFRFGLSLYTLNMSVDYIEEVNDKLYGVNEGYLVKLFDGEPAEWLYKSGDLVDGASTVVKMYNDIYIAYKGSVQGTVYIDDKKVANFNLSSLTYEVANVVVPQSLQRGYKLAIQLRGIGEVYELEYKIVGRQNGK